MAEIGAVEVGRRKRREFYSELEQYYRRRWNATLKIPYVSGRPVDFYLLYQKVVALGGWAKVSSGNRWQDVVDSMNIPPGCAASEHAIKSIYMRYLAKFEQSQLFGENEGDNADGPGSSLSGRSQRGRLYLSSLTGQSGVSSCTRYASSTVLDRCHSGVNASSASSSGSVLEGPQCERLIKSLKSGLPNEVDFAINICTILSSPSNSRNVQTSLRLNNTPALVDLLLAHAGIFDRGESSYRQLYKDGCKPYTPDREFERFWLHYADNEDNLVKILLEPFSGSEKPQNDALSSTSSYPTNDALFCCLSLSAKELAVMTKRVEQIANILRNFSFEPDCRCALANKGSMIRYMLIAINSARVELQSMALDTLSNVASEMNLDDIDSSLLQLLMKTLSRCLHSGDKLRIVRALETIGNLCRNERNEAILCDYLEPVVIRRMIALLAVKDIMMCVYLLECLYQMTEMGRVPCQRLAEQPRAIDTLVQLVTVEAVSFGPNGLLGMKVVEYGMPSPHTAILPHPSKMAPAMNVALSASTTSSASYVPSAMTNVAIRPVRPTAESVAAPVPAPPPNTVHAPPPFLARPVRPVAAADSPIPARLNSPVPAAAVPPRQQTPPSSPKKNLAVAQTTKANDDNPIKTAVAVAPAATTVEQSYQQAATLRHRGPAVTLHQDQHVEQLTMNWIRQNCSAEPSNRVSRGELYTSYVQDMRGLYDSMAVSVTAFTNCVRQMFPSCTVRQLDNAINGDRSGGGAAAAACRSTLLEFDGLKFTRRNSLFRNNLISPQSAPSCSLSSSPPLSHVVSQHPLVQQILSSTACQEKEVPVGTVSNTIRVRSDSAGTLDSAYSVPGTPDSLSSGFSSTNSSTGVYGATSFSVGQQQQQPATSSPKAPRRISKAGVAKQPKVPESGSTAETTTANNNAGLVNGSISGTETVAGTDATTSAVCHLEVCHPAQEARAVIETGDSHEAKIVRVENTIAMVSSQFYQPDNSTPALPSTSSAPASSQAAVVNGAVAASGECSFNSDSNSNGCETTAKKGLTTSVSSTEACASTTALVDNLQKKKPTKKKKTAPATPPLNGLVKTLSSLDTSCNSVISGDSSPGPDTETMKQNVNQSIQSIQELLAGGSADEVKTEIVETDSTTTTTTPATNKKKGAANKRKASAANAAVCVADQEITDQPPPPKKKKYYPKKKKTVAGSAADAAATTPQKQNDESSRTSVNSPRASNSSPAVATASSPSPSFRLPLPPSGSQSPYAVQQAVIAAAATGSGTSGAPVIVRIPPPPAGHLKYVCEWDSCGKSFGSANAVYYHVSKSHIDDETRICRWPHCDQTARLRWSLVAHVQDIHCNDHALRTAAIRRYEISVCGFSNVPENRAPPPHPGYPPDAAIVAIRRHALVNLPKDIVDESEGPVTKSIRLTTSMILRNLARYSTDGRRILRKYEQFLTYLSFSRLESSAALAQCLAELDYSSPSKQSPNAAGQRNEENWELQLH